MISKETVCFLGIGDYVALKLTQNAEGVTEESMAASFGLYDLKKHCFDKSIINAAGIDFSYYPQTTVGKKVIGYYMKKPVFASIGDHQASFFGAVGDLEQSISLNVGTGSQVSVFHPEYVLYEQTEVRPFLGKGYLYVGASLNGGKVYERMAVFFEQVCEAFAGKKIDVYSKMYEIAKTKPDTSLRAVSNLYGQRGGKEKESGFFGLTSDNFYPADVIRSFVNSMGLELWGLYQKFPENIRENRIKITASGNGIRKNKLLIEEIEKIFDLPVVFSELKEEAAAGAADFALWRLRTQ